MDLDSPKPASATGNTNATTISLVWVVAYLALHHSFAQIANFDYMFCCLRVAFVALFLFAMGRQNVVQLLRQITFGRMLKNKADWTTAAVCLALIVALRITLSRLFHFAPEAFTVSGFIDEAIIPPLNEEVVFRGIILASLLASMPGNPCSAIILSGLIFIGVHNIEDSGPGLVVSLTIQSAIYGVCYWRTNCIPLCMLLHAIWNSLLWCIPMGWYIA